MILSNISLISYSIIDNFSKKKAQSTSPVLSLVYISLVQFDASQLNNTSISILFRVVSDSYALINPLNYS